MFFLDFKMSYYELKKISALTDRLILIQLCPLLDNNLPLCMAPQCVPLFGCHYRQFLVQKRWLQKEHGGLICPVQTAPQFERVNCQLESIQHDIKWTIWFLPEARHWVDNIVLHPFLPDLKYKKQSDIFQVFINKYEWHLYLGSLQIINYWVQNWLKFIIIPFRATMRSIINVGTVWVSFNNLLLRKPKC